VSVAAIANPIADSKVHHRKLLFVFEKPADNTTEIKMPLGFRGVCGGVIPDARSRGL